MLHLYLVQEEGAEAERSSEVKDKTGWGDSPFHPEKDMMLSIEASKILKTEETKRQQSKKKRHKKAEAGLKPASACAF